MMEGCVFYSYIYYWTQRLNKSLTIEFCNAFCDKFIAARLLLLPLIWAPLGLQRKSDLRSGTSLPFYNSKVLQVESIGRHISRVLIRVSLPSALIWPTFKEKSESKLIL